jgi:hypothetical protein
MRGTRLRRITIKTQERNSVDQLLEVQQRRKEDAVDNFITNVNLFKSQNLSKYCGNNSTKDTKVE